MLDRCYLSQGVPTLLVRGGRDPVVPVRHALRAHEAMPGSLLVVFPEAGHFPFRSDPRRFEQVLRQFLLSHEAGHVERGTVARGGPLRRPAGGRRCRRAAQRHLSAARVRPPVR